MLIRGYKYSTRRVVTYGDFQELRKLAKASNRQLRREHRLERFVVYPVPGCMPGMGQLMVMT